MFNKVCHKIVGYSGEVLPADLHVKWSGVNALALVRGVLRLTSGQRLLTA